MRSRYLPDELGLPAVPVKEALLRIVVITVGAALVCLLIVVLLIQNVWSLGVLLLSLRCGVLLLGGVCPTACYVLRVKVSGQADALALDQRSSQRLLLVAEGSGRAVTD